MAIHTKANSKMSDDSGDRTHERRIVYLLYSYENCPAHECFRQALPDFDSPKCRLLFSRIAASQIFFPLIIAHH